MTDSANERISWNEYRRQLALGLAELLALLPEGEEPVLRLAYPHGEEDWLALPAEARRPLVLLNNLSSAVAALLERRSGEEVRELLAAKQVAQMVVSGDESWYQLYVD